MAKQNTVHKLLKTSSELSNSLMYRSIPILLRLLIFVVLLGFLGGVIKTLVDLELLLKTSVENALRELLLNVLTLLAVIEVVKTALSYLSDGRVRVTYIVDTVLIVMLNEVISSWFKSVGIETWIPLVLVLMTLIIVRVLAIKFSPDEN